jgi:hypothetical protein
VIWWRGCEALVYDSTELARPAVDDRILDFLQTTTFYAGDFTRIADGACRLYTQSARAVVAACARASLSMDARSGIAVHLTRLPSSARLTTE